MLEPHDRSLYLEALRPPEGYRLDLAIGTTYSVDLVSLLAVPLSFAQLDWAEDRQDFLADPISLLRSLREHASKVTLFCQAGRIALPARHHPLFAYLEPMLVEAAAREKDGEFHAKTWLLRFIGPDGSSVRYRFVCLSRNLTTDRSWDTVLTLEGDLQDRVNAIAKNHPLGEFLEALPGLARAEVPGHLKRDIELVAREARRVRFEPPEPFDDIRFFPLGIEGHDGLDLETDGASRLLVVSPFVTKGLLEEIAHADENLLVSRQENLDELGAEAIEPFDKCYVLDDGAELDAQDASESRLESDPQDEAPETEPGARGLHAKLFVVERGWDVDVLTGSANATSAAFERNVEFLVQLTGKKSKVGIRALLGDGRSNDFLFGNLLQEYRPPAARPPVDEAGLANEQAVENARRALSRAELGLRAIPGATDGLFELQVDLRSALVLPRTVRARCWPSTVRPPESWNLSTLAPGRPLRFERLSAAQLTAFLSVEAVAGDGEAERAARFALSLPLEGAPSDRLEQVLASMLDEPGQFVRFLVLLLQDDEEVAAAALLRPTDRGTGSARRAEGWLPLLEELLRVLARSPERLREVHRLIEDLEKSPAGRKVLPDGFAEVWKPIWEASGVIP